MLRTWRIRRIVKWPQYNFSTISPASVNTKLSTDEKKVSTSNPDQSKLVAAAFASLKEISEESAAKKGARKDISSATDINSLLSIVEKPFLSRPNALIILSTLTSWVNEGKVKLNEFELDSRFIKLCRILGRSQGSKNENLTDLSVVLGVTADEQAAKLISSISLSQMVKILKSLSLKKRRSTPLLRSLAFNISNTSEQLDVKQASDILYSLAELNYPDEILLVKVREDLRLCLAANEKTSVICSAIRSLGLLRYRDTEMLDELFEWILKYHSSLGIKELLPLLFTLASVNYVPEVFPQFYKVLEPHLNENKMVDLKKFIHAAWSLVVLQQYDQRVINAVLDPAFITKLAAKHGSVENIDVPEKIHLLQINNAAKLLADSYKGILSSDKIQFSNHHLYKYKNINIERPEEIVYYMPRTERSFLEENTDFHQVSLSRRKEKQIMIDSIKDVISNVVTKLDEYVETDVNTNMGFFIDLVCYVDKKSNLVKINSKKTKDVKKIALMVCDYHDFCRCCSGELTGATILQHRLLSGLGYAVLPIPHTEYGPKDVLMDRVRYINEKIKTVFTET